jgi:hypothetical protein
MTIQRPPPQRFNILAIGQTGRLAYEAILLAASLRETNPNFSGRLFIGEAQPGPLWKDDPRIANPAIREHLQMLGAEFLPFESRAFGESYPYGNKIEALFALPDEPFLFLDTDTLITGPLDSLSFDFERPSASMQREGTWPTIELYGPSYAKIWKPLYDRFALDFETSLDLTQPDDYWQRYLYFNAGWFYYQSPHRFAERFLEYALSFRDHPTPELVCQPLFPWLDQIALPLVIHSFGGGRPSPNLAGLDGDVTRHWRCLPLLYARESDAVVTLLEQICAPNQMKRLLRDYEPFKKLVYQGKGAQIRALFDRTNLPRREQMIRNTIKREGLWYR